MRSISFLYHMIPPKMTVIAENYKYVLPMHTYLTISEIISLDQRLKPWTKRETAQK